MTRSSKLFTAVLLLAVAAPVAAQDELNGYTRLPNSDYYTYREPVITVQSRHADEDVFITEEVKDTLAADPRLDPSRIAVDTERNVVRLSGLVETPGQAAIATRDAHRIDGVTEVRNYLRTRVGS